MSWELSVLVFVFQCVSRLVVGWLGVSFLGSDSLSGLHSFFQIHASAGLNSSVLRWSADGLVFCSAEGSSGPRFWEPDCCGTAAVCCGAENKRRFLRQSTKLSAGLWETTVKEYPSVYRMPFRSGKLAKQIASLIVRVCDSRRDHRRWLSRRSHSRTHEQNAAQKDCPKNTSSKLCRSRICLKS